MSKQCKTYTRGFHTQLHTQNGTHQATLDILTPGEGERSKRTFSIV